MPVLFVCYDVQLIPEVDQFRQFLQQVGDVARVYARSRTAGAAATGMDRVILVEAAVDHYIRFDLNIHTMCK